MDKSQEAGSEFVEAGGDPTELLELEEEGFHKVTLLVKHQSTYHGSELSILGGIQKSASWLAMNSRNSHLP